MGCMMRKLIVGVIFALALNGAMAVKVINESVAQWVLDNNAGQINSFTSPPTFSGAAISVSGTGAIECAGVLVLPSKASIDDWRLFQTFYVTAKAANLKMTIYYDEVARCAINRFSLTAN